VATLHAEVDADEWITSAVLPPVPTVAMGSVRPEQYLARVTLRLRPATAEDAKQLFRWVNDPLGRENAFNSDPIAWEDHLRWLAQRLADPGQAMILLAFADAEPMGQIRFEREADRARIDFSVDPLQRRKGYGVRLLQLGTAEIVAHWSGLGSVYGLVKSNNIASCRAFARAGFAGRVRTDGVHEFSLTLGHTPAMGSER